MNRSVRAALDTLVIAVQVRILAVQQWMKGFTVGYMFVGDKWICADCHGHGNSVCVSYLRAMGKSPRSDQCCKCYYLEEKDENKKHPRSAV